MIRILIVVSALLILSFNPAQARYHRHSHGLPWCGIYMMQHFGLHDRSLWIARNWARIGSNAGGPAVGAIVVWPHHVGKIVGKSSNGQWIVHSGNDGGAVRTRPRSVAGAIAFRWL